MTTAETYVTAAYLVFLGVVLLYVVIYSFRIAALEHAVAEIEEQTNAAPSLPASAVEDRERAIAAPMR